MEFQKADMRRERLTRRRVLAMLGAGAVSIAAAGCASPPAETPKAAQPSNPAPGVAGSPAASSSQASGSQSRAVSDTVVVGSSIDPRTLDPRTIGGDLAWTEMHHVLEPLIEFDSQGKMSYLLATSHTRPDPMTWQFKLRQGVKFHNDEPFNAESVKYTIESTLDPAAKYVNASYVRDIARVDVVDNYTVNLVTSIPARSLLTNLAWSYMLPPKASRDLGDKFGTNPVGTGPFKFVRYVANSVVDLTANESYWGTPAKTKNLTWKALPEEATRLAALETGEVQLIPNVSPDVIDRLKSNNNLDVVVVEGTRVMHLAFTWGRPPFDNPKVREAFQFAVDRQALMETILGSMGKVDDRYYYHPTTQFTVPMDQPLTYDPAKAKQLLADAGHPDGITVRFGCPSGRYLRDKLIGEAITDQLKRAGITAQLETSEWGSFWDKAMVQRGYDLVFMGFGASVDPHFELNWWFDSRNSPTKYGNPRLDELLAQGQKAISDDESKAIYTEAQQILYKDMPWVPLYFQPEIYAKNKNLAELNIRTIVPQLDLRHAFTQA